MVIGDRLSSTYFSENKRPFHNSGNMLVRKLINWFFKTDIKDIMTGYRAFSYNFVKSFPILSKGFEIETEITIHALDKNLNIEEVPIPYRDRPEGSFSKLNTYKDGMKVILTIFNLYRFYRPLKFFSIFAILFLILSFLLFIPVLIEYINTGLVPKTPTLIVSSISAVLSVLSFNIGLTLDAIYKNARQKFELSLNIINRLKDR